MSDLAFEMGGLVEMAVTGQVSQPAMRPNGYVHWPDGRADVLPGMYGITYNARVGDRAFGWAGDHVEPGVSIANADEKADFALHYLTCIGNEATVVSAGWRRGRKASSRANTRASSWISRPDVLERMTIGDTVQIRAVGRGIRLSAYPMIEFKKTSPALARAYGLREENGQVICPVAMELPARIMGSGAELNAEFVDQDLMSGDRALMADLGIDTMRWATSSRSATWTTASGGRSARAGWRSASASTAIR
jgi:hypothetical protein